MTNTNDTNRAEFEDHIKRKFPHSWQLDLHINIHGEYVSMQIQAMFEAWQSARAQPTVNDSLTVQTERVALSDAEITEIIRRTLTPMLNIGLTACELNLFSAALNDFARAILSAQADGPVIDYGTKNATPPITQPLIAEAARDDVAVDAAHRRLLNAATTYANNYLQDERDEPELCIHTGQHAEIVELFAAIAASTKENQS